MLAAALEENDGWIPVRSGRGAADVALRSETQSAVARMQWGDGEHALSARLAGYSEERSAGLVGADSAVSGSSLSVDLGAPQRAVRLAPASLGDAVGSRQLLRRHRAGPQLHHPRERSALHSCKRLGRQRRRALDGRK